MHSAVAINAVGEEEAVRICDTVETRRKAGLRIVHVSVSHVDDIVALLRAIILAFDPKPLT